MNALQRRPVRLGVLCACLAAAAAFVMAFAHSTPQNGRLEADQIGFPERLGDWSGRDLEVDDRTYELLETKNVLMREYDAPGRLPVILCLVFSRENRKVSHPPEVCYQGSGYEVVSRSREKTGIMTGRGKALEANKLRIERGGDRETVLYWYKTGTQYTVDYYRQQWRALLGRLRGKGRLSALVRISAPDAGDGTEAEKDLEDFGRELLPVLNEKLK